MYVKTCAFKYIFMKLIYLRTLENLWILNIKLNLPGNEKKQKT